LLRELVEVASPNHREELIAALAAGRFLDVAAVLELDTRVQATGIAESIRRHYARPRIPRPEIYDLVAHLPVTQFVTTNYDPWLRDAVSRNLDAAPRVYTPWDDAAWENLGQSSPPLVLMLHGDADRPSTCVLSASMFRRLKHYQAFQNGFNGLIQGRSLLFLGHSLRDPDLELMLEVWAEAMAASTSGVLAPRHYMLTPTVGALERTRLLGLGIQVVEYGPAGDYAALATVLEFLRLAPPTIEPSKVAAVQESGPLATPTAPLHARGNPERWRQVNVVVDAQRQLLGGDLSAAKATIARGREEHGESALFLSIEGVLFAREGRAPESVAVSHRVLQEFRDEISLAEAAVHAWGAGNNDDALATSVDALARDPGNVLVWLVRAAILSGRDPRRAARNIDIALDVYIPLYQAWALRMRAQLLLKFHEADQALQAASSAVALAPHSPSAYDTRSSVLLRLNRVEEALADIDMAIRLAPAWSEPYRMKAAVLADAKHYQNAISAATSALKVGGDDWLMYEIRASCLLELGQKRAAAADIVKARELNPTSESIAGLSARLGDK
jgi:tetratricopeptide (TPR) repeat protein